MALTRDEALKKALMQQATTGAKGAIDEGYVKTLMTGEDAGYTKGIIDANKPNPIVSALTQTNTAPTRPKDTNLTDLMTQQSKANTDATLSAIRQRIAESKANQQALIDKSGQTYDPMRAQSEVAKSQQLISSLERSANMGDRGGIGRQEALTTQTEGENRLNQINLQQQNFVDSANQEISRLENEGKFQEAQAVYEQRSRDLQNAIEEARRQEDIQRQDRQTQEAQSREDFGASIGANYNDLQAYANQLIQQGAPEWQINQVLSARQGKLGDIAKGQTEQQSALYKMAMDKWESGIPVNAQEANALGVRVGSVKPVKSSGGGGLTNAQEWNRIKDKIDMGIPLTPQEQAILGGVPTQTGDPISDSFAIAGLEEIVNRYPVKDPKNIGEYLFKSANEADRETKLSKELQNYFKQLAENGYPIRELKLLGSRYGVDIGNINAKDETTGSTN